MPVQKVRACRYCVADQCRNAHLLIMPNVDAAHISYNLLKIAAGSGITVGPILLGTAKPVHILEPAVSVRRIVNMTALAVVDAGVQR